MIDTTPQNPWLFLCAFRYAETARSFRIEIMVKHADESPEAQLLHRQQSRRLQHFRRALGVSRATAGEMAGVSRFTWRRMEDGTARIDTVPLRRFLAAYERIPNLPGEYVLSGSLAGLPAFLQRDLIQLDRDEPEDFGGGSSPPSGGNGGQPTIGILGKPQRRRRGGSGTQLMEAGQLAA